jgi:hypothetical protein
LDYASFHPTTAALVVEVSQSSLPLDRSKKRGYALAKVSESWIVNIEKRCVEIFMNPQGEDYVSAEIIDMNGSIKVQDYELRVGDFFPPDSSEQKP